MVYIYICLISMFIVIILMIINLIISKKMIKDREKKTSYECGFDSLDSSRLPFSVYFFTVSLIFLIFDVELVLLFPVIISIWINFKYMVVIYMGFLFFFFLGLIIEWMEGLLDWGY